MRPKRRLVATLLFSTAIAPACATDDREPSPDEQADVQLLGLRSELIQTAKPDAVGQTAHFRPICDVAGYPLVGNVANKGPALGYQPSEFCAELREHGE